MSSPPPAPGVPISSAPIEPGKGPGGCLRGALIGCGAAAILVLILLAVFAAYVRRKPEALTDFLMNQIERNFTPEVTAEQKQQLRTAYADFRVRLRQRAVRPEALEKLRRILSGAATGSVGPEQVRELTEVFSEPPPGSAPRPSPRAPDTSAPVPALSPTP